MSGARKALWIIVYPLLDKNGIPQKLRWKNNKLLISWVQHASGWFPDHFVADKTQRTPSIKNGVQIARVGKKEVLIFILFKPLLSFLNGDPPF